MNISQRICLIIFVAFVPSQTVDAFACPSTRFFSDVKGLTIRCYQYPDDKSTLAFCFKDLWWKTLVFRPFLAKPVFDPNPFSLLDLDVCRSRCGCRLYLSFFEFNCMPRGLAPSWSKSLPLHLRNSVNCRNLRLPPELETNADSILFSATLMAVAPRAEELPMLRDLGESLSRLRIREVEVHFHQMQPLIAADVAATLQQTSVFTFASWYPVTSLDNFFLNNTFKDLISLTFYVNGDPTQLQWPLMEVNLKLVTSQLKVFSLYDFNITSIPKLPFARSLLCLVCSRCYSLIEAPIWLRESPNILFLHIANAVNFRLNDLPAMPSLLHFSFSDSNYGSLPDNWYPSKLYPNLEHLDLSYLNLSAVPFNLLKNMTRLLRLDLSGNCLNPLPSFQGLTKLVLLDLSSITLIVGSPTPTINSDAFRTNGKCVYGRCTSLRLRGSDLSDLTSLKDLTVSYYRDLRLDDDAFANLSKLTSLVITCANQSRLPATLKYTSQLQQLTAIVNPFDRLDSNPTFWSIPLFIPKFYNKLRLFDIRYTNINILPPSLLAFNISKAATIVSWLSYSMANNPLSKNQCELHKFEKAFRLMSTMSPSFANQSAVCDQGFETSMSIVQQALNNVTDYCLRSAAILHASPVEASFVIGLITIFLEVLIKIFTNY